MNTNEFTADLVLHKQHNVRASKGIQDYGLGTVEVCNCSIRWANDSAEFELRYTGLLKYSVYYCFLDDLPKGLILTSAIAGKNDDVNLCFDCYDNLVSTLEVLCKVVPVRDYVGSLEKQLAVKTNVTCIKFVGELIFVGIGDTLFIFGRTESGWECCSSRRIFCGQAIYGIECRPGKNVLVIYGGKLVSIICFIFSSKLSQLCSVCSFEAPDRILDFVWFSSTQGVALLTANNALLRYDLLPKDPKLTAVSYCEERCILYSGKILNDVWEDLTVLAGTVFSTIMIWCNSHDGDHKPVIQQLTRHKGVIFSVQFCHQTQRITSTSDDRTVRIWDVQFNDPNRQNWNDCLISLKYTFYGHSARVWKSTFITDGGTVSVGEDSRICLWNKDGTLDNQWNGHQNGEIWSLDVSNELKLIATGGSDGGVSLWPISKMPIPHLLEFDEKLKGRTPRTVGLTSDGSPVMLDNFGDISLYTEGTWTFCFNDSRFSSYCILSVSPNRTLVAFGSISGCILVCRFATGTILKIIDATVCNGRIFSLIWLSESSLSICESEGKFSIWNICLNSLTVSKVSEFVLPKSRERWITCCTTDGNYYVCGDRAGSLFLYSKYENDQNPKFIAKKIHGSSGTTDVKCLGSKVVSTGRDGKCREFIIDDNKLVLISCLKLKFDWAASIVNIPRLGNILICFHDVYFVIWSVRERRAVLKIDCGGGHRSWDCFIDGSNDSIFLTYIKGKLVHYCSIPIKEVICNNLLPGGHPKSINAAAFVQLPHGNELHPGKLVLLGGEDTTLRLISLESDCQNELRVLQSHLSSVRAIGCHVSSDEIVYVASGGGRGQLILWKVFYVASQNLLELAELVSYCVMQPSQKKNSENNEISNDIAEMRLMDLVIIERSSRSINVASCCSDGILRLFDFNWETNVICPLQSIDRGHCLLKILSITTENFTCLVTADTSGKLTFHNATKHLDEISVINHENTYSVCDSGINSCDFKYVDDKLFISTGGDDSHLNIMAFTWNDKWEMLHHWQDGTAHWCQISGLKMIDKLVITAGLDQLMSIFCWEFTDNEVKGTLVVRVNLSIPDIHGCLVWQIKENSCYVYIYGLGTQLLEFSRIQNVQDLQP